MLGYYNSEPATKEIKRLHSDGSVWIHSGDIGYMTENGSIFILDRVKKMIIRYDGFKVFPSLIEKTVLTHKAVISCCAVGTRDNEHSQGKLPIVFIVPDFEYGKEAEIKQELIVLCKKELPEYAWPMDFIFLDTLPVTPIGKIDYRALEKEAALIDN